MAVTRYLLRASTTTPSAVTTTILYTTPHCGKKRCASGMSFGTGNGERPNASTSGSGSGNSKCENSNAVPVSIC